MRILLAPIALLVGGCADDALPDTVPMALRLRDTTLDGRPVTWDVGTLDVRVVRLRPCPDDPVVLDWPGGLPDDVRTLPGRAAPQPWTVGYDDLLPAVPPRRFPVRIGPWCELDLLLRGELSVVGHVEDGGQIALIVDLPHLGVVADDPFADVELATRLVNGVEKTRATVRPLVAELGADDWLEVVPDAPAAGEQLAIAPGDPLHDAVRAALLADAALYRDLDDDGVVGPREHEVARIGGLQAL